MPGLVLFGRRWVISSDDFVIPATICAILHGLWCLGIIATISAWSTTSESNGTWIERSLLGLNITFVFCQFLNTLFDLLIAKISSNGSILDDTERKRLPKFLYSRCGLLGISSLPTLAGIVWLAWNYNDVFASSSLRKCLLATIIWQLISYLTIGSLIWGCYDSAGRNWLLLKRFEDRSQHTCRTYKRSATRRRTWRRRKVILAYQDSWRRRLRLMAGCIGATEDDKAALAEVAKLFTEFFYQVDVVPSDLLAGFALLRRKQKHREFKMTQQLLHKKDTKIAKILSGAMLGEKVKIMDCSKPEEINEIRTLRYYMQYALAAYGWPFYLTNNKYGRLWDLLLNIRVLPRPACLTSLALQGPTVLEDNCLSCHSTAVRLTLPSAYVTLIYACWHSHIGHTPFYVAVDHREKTVVLCVRGTMSMNDFITDFNAQPENIPLVDPRPSSGLQAHRGMIVAANYVYQRLKSETILEEAFSKASPGYRLVIVGHSLGGGAATVLAMLLRPSYPDLHCYVFAPPGGLLTKDAVDLTRNYITTLIIGKDMVARLALAQMEIMRTELVRLLTVCTEPKYRILGTSMGCCTSSELLREQLLSEEEIAQFENRCRAKVASRTSSSAVPMLFPPGNIIHIVRSWSQDKSILKKPEYVALRSANECFDEILVSPVMVHDHMPEGVIEALDGLLEQIDSSPSRSIARESSSSVGETAITAVGNDNDKEDVNVDEDRKISSEPSVHLNFCESGFREEIV